MPTEPNWLTPEEIADYRQCTLFADADIARLCDAAEAANRLREENARLKGLLREAFPYNDTEYVLREPTFSWSFKDLMKRIHEAIGEPVRPGEVQE